MSKVKLKDRNSDILAYTYVFGRVDFRRIGLQVSASFVQQTFFNTKNDLSFFFFFLWNAFGRYKIHNPVVEQAILFFTVIADPDPPG
jgi:hypothetical protein